MSKSVTSIRFALLTCVVSLAFPMQSQAAASSAMRHQDPEQIAERYQRLDAFVRKTMAETAVPGVAVGVLHEGETRTAGYGVTNVDHRLEVTPGTLFQIGSISKTLTGTAIMRLVDRGLIELDAPIRTYIPDFDLADEATAARATVRHLVTHMGGWVGDLFKGTGEGDDALDRIVAEMADLEQLAPLGTVYSYNNSGYYVAGKIVEAVTGQTFEHALQELVLDPLGLDRMYLGPDEVITRRFAVGHSVTPDGVSVARPWALYRAANPAGGIVTDVGQMLKYASFHLGDGTNDRGERILSSRSIREMQAEHAPKVGLDGAMGITWHLDRVGGVRTVSHGGGTIGQISLLLPVPERDFAVAIVTNADRGGVVTAAVSRWLLEEFLDLSDALPVAEQKPDGDLEEFAGLYERPFQDVEVEVQSGRLMIRGIPKQSFPTPDVPVPPAGLQLSFGFYAPDRVVQFDGAGQAEFIRKDDGSVGWIRFGGRIHVRR